MTQLQAILLAGALLSNSFIQEEQAWRTKRHNRLMSEDGWLTLVGLYWLHEGENPIEPFGTFTLLKVKVIYKGKELKSDESDTYDTIQNGELHALIHKVGAKVGVRVKNPKSPVRTEFKGIDYYDPK